MKRKGFITIVVFSILAILFLTTCLRIEKGKEEGEFRKIAVEMKSILSTNEELLQKSSSFAAYEKESVQKFSVQSNVLAMRLRRFIINYPASAYADDAAYILVQLAVRSPLEEKYIQKQRLFLEKYPKASLEPFTLDTLPIVCMFAKGIGVIDAVKMEISQNLYFLKRYEESAKETKVVIDDLSVKTLSTLGYRLLGLNYIVLMKDYEAQNKNEQVRRVCNEAIEKIPNVKTKEIFIKKLKELDSVSK